MRPGVIKGNFENQYVIHLAADEVELSASCSGLFIRGKVTVSVGSLPQSRLRRDMPADEHRYALDKWLNVRSVARAALDTVYWNITPGRPSTDQQTPW